MQAQPFDALSRSSLGDKLKANAMSFICLLSVLYLQVNLECETIIREFFPSLPNTSGGLGIQFAINASFTADD